METATLITLVAAGAAFLTMFGAIAGWLVHLEKRINNKLSFEQHQAICDRRDSHIEKLVDEIKADAKGREATHTQFRHEMRNSMQVITTRIEVLTTQLKLLRPDGNFP